MAARIGSPGDTERAKTSGMSAFQIQSFPIERVSHLFGLTDHALDEYGARRIVAQSEFGFPCRVQLADVPAGESLIALSFEHLPAASPYRASGPIFVSEATPSTPATNELPAMLLRRDLSLRAYDANDEMVDAEVVAGTGAAKVLQRLFDRREVAYVHVHLQPRGCFACEVHRA